MSLGKAWTQVDYRREVRGDHYVLIGVHDDGSEAEASLTAREARQFAIKVLVAAQRCERHELSAKRKAVRGAKAVDIARAALDEARR